MTGAQGVKAEQKQQWSLKSNTMQRLSFAKDQKEVPSVRIELTTLGLLDPRSNQLSYEGIYLSMWWLSPIIIATISREAVVLVFADGLFDV